jgi:hypothetical protein
MAAARRSSRGAPIPLAIEQLLRDACHINSPAGGTNTSWTLVALAPWSAAAFSAQESKLVSFSGRAEQDRASSPSGTRLQIH